MGKFEAINLRFAIIYATLQLITLLLFAFCVGYGPSADARQPAESLAVRYGLWQDVHVMVYVGFGFLLVFNGRHSWSSVGFNLLLSAFAWQWSVLCYGFWAKVAEGDFSEPIPLDIKMLIAADFSAATVMVTFSGVLGKLSPLQYLLMTFFEVIIISTNQFIGEAKFGAEDEGGSMFIHTFGCYFGLALSWIMFFRNKTYNPLNHPHNITTYNSDTFSMIGTLFLWIFWPSFNGALADGAAQHRAIINTLLSIVASAGATFAVSGLFRGKFGMPEVQNSTLAGGVAMGTCSTMMIEPWAALLIGTCAGSLSTLGFIYLTPFLERTVKLHDTAGIHNLHGIPGLIGSFAGVFAALHASPDKYGDYVGYVFPHMGTSNETLAWELGLPEPGHDRSANTQGGMQAAAIGVTLGLAISSGLFVGAFLRIPVFDQPLRKDQFDDSVSSF
eukprot:TRINITY_DN6778_c0_g1_i1.p1 TRINITY_DN6778_c0_g1~~TRINITY_DN6778_c0_g1_i1.p1  ORF type:complete len:451 (-),score=26.14 TRINITY_DN6778_c0_g1_i1:284-1615(-)